MKTIKIFSLLSSSFSFLYDLIKRNKKANIVAKIESIKGLRYILNNKQGIIFLALLFYKC